MRVLAGQRDLQPPQALAMGDHADVLALGLQDRALFDVEFEHRLHLAGADFLRPDPADALEFGAAANCLKHSIHGDSNATSVEEVDALSSTSRFGQLRR